VTSPKRIAAATAGAFTLAALVLVAVVLPAEYGRDPIGTGKALGLLDLYEAKTDHAPTPAPPAAGAARPRTYKVDSSELTLGPKQAFEYKYRLEQGASMVYAWSTEAPITFEFHGEPYDHTLKVITYEKQQSDHASGSLTAPFAGIHGWYWENPTERPLTITIHSAGFFTSAEELRPKYDPAKHRNRIEEIPHELRDPPK
jgi:hypothetical protein